MDSILKKMTGMGVSPDPVESASGTRKSLYLRVREQVLRDLITRNTDSNDRYYTETELAKRFSVCRNTVRRALGDLEQEGYITRHRKIGTIINKKNVHSETGSSNQTLTLNSLHTETRQRVIVMLPAWNDSVEGFYTGKLLRALSSPDLTPPLAIEIRHYNDSLILNQPEDAAIISIDPHPAAYEKFQKLADQGVHIIAIEPQHPIPGLINLFTDRRTIVCQAVKKFYEMGHRAVGIINSKLNHLDFERSLLGYLDAHHELDLPIPSTGIEQEASSFRVLPVPDVKRISAWVCSYMSSINFVANECWKAGLSIPRDVSIICLDDPGDVPFASIGKKISVVTSDSVAAASLIHTYLNDWREERRETTIFIPSEWKDRETIAPPNMTKISVEKDSSKP